MAFGLSISTAHTIAVKVSVPPREQPDVAGDLSGFAFDYIIIQPPDSTTLWDNQNQDISILALAQMDAQSQTILQPNRSFGLFIDNPTGQIANLSREWKFDSGNGFYTTISGSQFNITFIGRSNWKSYIDGTNMDIMYLNRYISLVVWVWQYYSPGGRYL